MWTWPSIREVRAGCSAAPARRPKSRPGRIQRAWVGPLADRAFATSGAVSAPSAQIRDRRIKVAGDKSPEGLRVTTADESPTGASILAIANVVGGALSLVGLTAAEEALTVICDLQGTGDVSGFGMLAQVGPDDVSAMVGQTVAIEAAVAADHQSGAQGGW